MALMYYSKIKLLLLQKFKLLLGRIILKVLGKHGCVKISQSRIVLLFFSSKNCWLPSQWPFHSVFLNRAGKTVSPSSIPRMHFWWGGESSTTPVWNISSCMCVFPAKARCFHVCTVSHMPALGAREGISSLKHKDTSVPLCWQLGKKRPISLCLERAVAVCHLCQSQNFMGWSWRVSVRDSCHVFSSRDRWYCWRLHYAWNSKNAPCHSVCSSWLSCFSLLFSLVSKVCLKLVWFNTRLTETGINYCSYCWLSAQPSLSAEHIAFLISHCFSFTFLWCYPATHCRLLDSSSAARSIKQWVSWSASAWSGSERPSSQTERLLGCPSEPVLAGTAGTHCKRPGSARSHSCSLKSTDRFSPGDLVICSDFVAYCWEWTSWWRCYYLSGLKWARGTWVWCCTNCFAWDTARKK